MVKWKVQVYEDLSSIRPIWQRLFDATPNPGPFMTWDYAVIWWQHFGTEFKPYILVAQHPDDAQNCVMLPLMKGKGQLRWAATPGPDNVALLYDHIECVADGIQAIGDFLGRKQWAKLSLTYLPTQDAELLTQGLNQFTYRTIENTGSPYIPMEGLTWDTYLKSLSHSRRDNMRAVHRKLEKAGLNFRIDYYREPEKFKEFFPVIKDLMMGDDIEGKHDLVQGEQADYWLDLCMEYAAKGWMVLAVMYLNDQPAAFTICFTVKGVTGYWRASFDQQYGQYSLGKLLLYYMLKYSFEQGMTKFDFMFGLHPYKMLWTDAVQPLSYIVMYRHALMNTLVNQFSTLRSTLVSALAK